MKLYQIDAFTDKLFAGNPAGVMIMKDWLEDPIMQNIAAENNLAETAFVVPFKSGYMIRWFTPTVEVELCGHATLASAWVLFNVFFVRKRKLNFYTLHSGELSVERKGDNLVLNFPADDLTLTDKDLQDHLGAKPLEVYKGKTDYVAVFATQQDIENISPDMKKVAQLEGRGVIVTAKGDNVDFVSRFFAPQSGVDEDPVTGSAHTSLTPLWAEKLNKTKLKAKQLSKRGGDLFCELRDRRCLIGGQARMYMEADIHI